MKNIDQNPANSLPRLHDQFVKRFTADVLLDPESPQGGLAQSMSRGSSNRLLRVGLFRPGQDIQDIRWGETYASGGTPYAEIKRSKDSAPGAMHIVIDQPKRTESLNGVEPYLGLADYMLALCCATAEVTQGTGLSIYHNSSSRAVVEDLDPDEAAQGYRKLREARSRQYESEELSTKELIELASRNVDSKDALIVVSDLVDGYVAEEGEFDWEAPLRRVKHNISDLMRVLRISSPAHGVVPDLDPAIPDYLMEGMNLGYQDTAAKKEARISEFGSWINSSGDGPAICFEQVSMADKIRKSSSAMVSLLHGPGVEQY